MTTNDADWLEEQAQALGGESLNSEVPSGSSPQQEKPDDRPRCPYCGQPHSKFGFYTANKKNDD